MESDLKHIFINCDRAESASDRVAYRQVCVDDKSELFWLSAVTVDVFRWHLYTEGDSDTVILPVVKTTIGKKYLYSTSLDQIQHIRQQSNVSITV